MNYGQKFPAEGFIRPLLVLGARLFHIHDFTDWLHIDESLFMPLAQGTL